MATSHTKDHARTLTNYISSAEAAKMLNVSKQRISALCKSGKVQAIKVGGYYFPLRASVEAYKNNPARTLYLGRRGVDK